LTKGGDIFPVLAKILQPFKTRKEPSREMVESGGDKLSPALVSFQESPHVGDESVKIRPSLWKAQHLSEEDRVEAGIATPVTWESDPLAMRSKERRSKANGDLPSLALKMVAQQLSFTKEEDQVQEKEGGEAQRIEDKALEGELFAEGPVVAELVAPVSRAPRSRASPVAAADLVPVEQAHPRLRSWRKRSSAQKTRPQVCPNRSIISPSCKIFPMLLYFRFCAIVASFFPLLRETLLPYFPCCGHGNWLRRS
jgi:hypothetical protein